MWKLNLPFYSHFSEWNLSLGMMFTDVFSYVSKVILIKYPSKVPLEPNGVVDSLDFSKAVSPNINAYIINYMGNKMEIVLVAYMSVIHIRETLTLSYIL